MDVRSAFNSGLAGFQDASAQLSNASSRIAQAGIAEIGMTENMRPLESHSLSAERTPISLTTELVNLKVAEFQATASAKVITTADDALGSLIDVTV